MFLQLDIVQQNYITSHSLHAPIAHTEIEHVTFSDNGDWLATVERRDDGETMAEMRMRLFVFNEEQQR